MVNDNKEDRSREILGLEIQIKKLQIMIALVTLIGVMITALNTWKLFLTDTKIGAAAEQLDNIQSLLDEKPFEGEWVYSSQYERYYDEHRPHELHGRGRAIIIWKKLQGRKNLELCCFPEDMDDWKYDA